MFTTALLIWVFFTCLVLGKTSRIVPPNELHRRLRGIGGAQKKCANAFEFPASLKWLVWLGGVISGAVLMGRSYEKGWWLATLFLLIVSGILFVWHPKQVRGWNWSYCGIIAPVLVKLFTYTEVALGKTTWLTNKLWPVSVHAGVYTKQDLADLIVKQKDLPENQIPELDLRVAYGGLMFGDTKVLQVMTPARKVKTVFENDPVSPHLMDELHASGFSRFPVISGGGNFISKDVVGTLYLRELVNNSKSVSVADVMGKSPAFIHEKCSLRQALNAFIKTRHHLLVVVNNFEEVVGVISIEDVVEQIVGVRILDEFDQYEDLRAVAAREASSDARNHATTTTKQSDETVVE